MKKNSVLISVFICSMFFLIFLVSFNSLISKEKTTLDNMTVKKVIFENDSIKLEYPEFDNSEMNSLMHNIIRELESTSGNITYQSNIIDKKVYSILFSLPNNQYQSFLIDINTYEEVPIRNIFKNKNDDVFNEKIAEALKNKYPAFIYNSILSGNGTESYLVLDNEIYVYFSNYQYTPMINDNIYVRINYHELIDYLDIPYILDEVYINDNVYTLDPNKKTVVFTFDDGPKKSTTTEMIEILKDNHATATFFMLGSRMTGNEELIKKLISYGNEVGNHSYSHKYLTRIKGAELENEINYVNNKYTEITGDTVKYFRVPYGSINENVRQSINNPIIKWDVDPLDWKYKNAETVKENVLAKVKDGDIVLMHDIHLTTVEAVRLILPNLYAQGYQVVSVSDYLNLYNLTLENNVVYKRLK